MSLEIQIHGHVTGESVYYPGDALSGVVRLVGPINESRLSLNLNLFGGSWVHVKGKEDYNCLLKQGLRLFEGPLHIYPDGARSWAFCVKIPTNTDTPETESITPGGTTWAGDDHPLPPSMDIRQTRLGRYRIEDQSQIEYGLMATAWGWDDSKLDLKVKQPLTIRMGSTKSIAYTAVHKEKIDFGNQSKVGMAIDSVKKALQLREPLRVNLEVSAPKSMELNRRADFVLNITQSNRAVGFEDEVYLLSVKHEIHSHTSSRTIKTGRCWSKFDVATYRCDFEGKRLEMGQYVHLSKDIFAELSETKFAPSFKSYGISQKYRSTTTVKIQHGNVVRKFRFNVDDLQVLPRRRTRTEHPKESSWTRRAIMEHGLGEVHDLGPKMFYDGSDNPYVRRHIVGFPMPFMGPVSCSSQTFYRPRSRKLDKSVRFQ